MSISISATRANWGAWVFLTALLWGCASHSGMAEEGFSGSTQTGWISYYPERFQGRKTASGELFDKNAFTAAHRHLPFGTRVRVTNLRNGRSVVVRINDRGPWEKERILDVSPIAARRLGMLGRGTVRAKVEVLR